MRSNQSQIMGTALRGGPAGFLDPGVELRQAHEVDLEQGRIEITDHAAGVDYLRRCLPHLNDMASMRRLIAETHVGAAHGLRDHDVIDVVAHLLASGRLHLVLPKEEPRAEVLDPMEAQPARPKPPPREQPPPRRQKIRPQTREEPPEPSMVKGLAQDVQAKTLLNASESGAPFCEECEKRRNAA